MVYLSPPLLNTFVIVFFGVFSPPMHWFGPCCSFCLKVVRLEVEREDVVYQLPYID